MYKYYRLIYIIFIFIKYRLYYFFRYNGKLKYLFYIPDLIKFPRYSRGTSLKLFFENLGPVFVKFGQLLSTRGDFIPNDIIQELSLLQDKVAPFSPDLSIKIIEESFRKPINELFNDFSKIPVASASVAQVHSAITLDGKKVAIKIIRPNIKKIIDQDIKILYLLSWIIEKIWVDTCRLRLREVIGEFEKYIDDELDLVKEASNCNQLRRNFCLSRERKRLLIVPEVIWKLTCKNVFTMQFMIGIPINNIHKLRDANINISELASNGIKIFFTQVFFDGFFHADMHPGNIYVSNQKESLGQYIALDFGIVGSLSEMDKNYLAQNFVAFFQRNYRKVAQLHIESGWAPKGTREEELAGAVRTVCEPYFDRPLSEISLGKLLLRLFIISRRFNICIQPQLVLLQKTLLNVEGLGLQLEPSLNIWNIAQPFLETWMKSQIGIKGFLNLMKNESIYWSNFIPIIPRLLQNKINHSEYEDIVIEIKIIKKEQNLLKILLILMIFIICIMGIYII